MLRATLLYLSERPGINHFVRHSPLARRGASRFVAGEALELAERLANIAFIIGNVVRERLS